MPIRRDKPTALCTLDPARAVRAMADSLGRDARRELVELIVAAWVDAVPESELEGHFAKAIAGLAPEDLREIAGWPGTSGVAVALANREFLLRAFGALGGRRREALRIAACVRGAAAFDAGVSETQLLDSVLPCLSNAQLAELAHESLELYLNDWFGGEN